MSLYMHFLDIVSLVDVATTARANARRRNLKSRLSNTAWNLSDRQFVKRYRLTKKLTRKLIQELTPHMPPTLRSDALDVETKVLVALGFYATGSYQTMVGDSRKHCVSQASVSKALKQVTEALNQPGILNRFVCFPFKRCERETIKREFYDQFRLPGVLGCIDGTHVAIVKPKSHEGRFYNRKGYHSLNVLILCDSKLNIMSVDASYPGSIHDSVVWAHHELHNYVDNLHTIQGEDLYLLGDSGYPLRPTMMVPLTNPEPGSPEAYYQDLHLTARNVVERCIGILKARFRCLLVDRKLHYSPEVAAKITNACCVLHNMAHRALVPYTPLTAEEAARELELSRGTAGPAPRTSGQGLSQLQLGHARRQALIRRVWDNRITLGY